MSLTIQVKTSKKSIRLNKKFDAKSDTIFSVKQAYCDQETGKDPNKLNLIFNAKTLKENNATLYSVGMTRKVAIVTVTTKVIGGAYNNNGGNKTLTVQVKTSKKSIRLNQKFDPKQDTVFSVKQAYCDQETGKDPNKLNLIFNAKTLPNNEATLWSVGMTRKVAIVTVTTKVIGGAAALTGSQIMKSQRKRRLDKSDDEIKKMISNQNDCVFFEHEEDTAKMPCGHCFYASTMWNIIKTVVTKNEYEWEIRCPVPKCNAVFDFEIASKVADMTDDEYLFFADEFAKRNAPETKQCPNCGDDCERPADLTQFRVNCVACDGGDWCFLCAGKWQGGGFTVCGNNGCPSGDINKVLKECPVKETTYKDDKGNFVRVPTTRACPNCLEFIDHDDACKHMHCPACGHDFCFSCLKGKKDGSWQCNSYTYQCDIAPRQQVK
mmetsp:Transcript_71121/g.113023  ORF Transcript_71121/g.113023 Transcript_71121/m.113023 type:complete len:435 (-) Transcript_71121:175-1479(-)